MVRPVLHLASVLDVSGIPQVVLSSPPALKYLSAALLPDHRTVLAQDVDEALHELHRHGLLIVDAQATRYCEVRVSGLGQHAASKDLERNPGYYAAVVSAAADAILAVWPRVNSSGADPRLEETLRANAAALHQAVGEALWNPTTGSHLVLFRAATSFAFSHQGDIIGAFTELADAATRHLGADHPDTLTARRDLARWTGERGDLHAALAAYRALLPDTERVLGPDHPDSLATRRHLARWQRETGDAASAVMTLEALLPDVLRVLGPEHRDAFTTRLDLATAQGDAGDEPGAVIALEELLADQTRVLGPKHPDTVNTGTSIPYWRTQAALAVTRWRTQAARPYGETREYQERLAYRDRLAYQLSQLPHHPDTLPERGNLARWLGRLDNILARWRREPGDPTDAIAAYETILADRLNVLGPDDYHVFAIRHRIAQWQCAAGDAPGAIIALEALLPDVLRVMGPDVYETVVVRQDLARCRGLAGDVHGAIAAFEELLSDRLRVLGPNRHDHPEIQEIYEALTHWRRVARR